MDDTLPQKALSVRQPWAFLIVNGWKPVENRGRRTNIRGRILIHAALKFDHEGEEWVRATFPAIPLPGVSGRWSKSDWQLGGIVGEAEITGCITRGHMFMDSAAYAWHHASPWFIGPFGYVLANARRLPFIPCRGMLGFFAPTPTRTPNWRRAGDHTISCAG
jgi:ASCH domain